MLQWLVNSRNVTSTCSSLEHTGTLTWLQEVRELGGIKRERERLERAGMLCSNYRLFAEVVCLSDTNLHTCAHIPPTHTHTHTRTRARTHTHTHTHTLTHSHTITHTHTRGRAHARAHTHTHTHTHSLSLSLSLSRHLFQAGALACFYWILFLQSHVKPHS